MTPRRSKTTSLSPPLALRSERVLNEVVIPPTIANGLLLVTRLPGSLEAIDEQTGERHWSIPLSLVEGEQPHAGAPLVVDEFVYVRSGDELLTVELSSGKFDRQDGAPRLDLHEGAFVDNCIVSFTPGGKLSAWDVNQKSLRWSVNKEFSPVPLLGIGNTVVVGEVGSISAYDISDGKQIWSHKLESTIGALAIAPDGSVIAALAVEVIKLETTNGDGRWRTIGDVTRTGTLAVTDDEIHLLDLRRYRRLSAESGREIFSQQLNREQMPKVRGSLGRIAVSTTHVFAGDLRGPIIAVSRKGEVDWKWEEERPRAASVAPVLSDERLYALTFDGTLQCFEHTT